MYYWYLYHNSSFYPEFVYENYPISPALFFTFFSDEPMDRHFVIEVGY